MRGRAENQRSVAVALAWLFAGCAACGGTIATPTATLADSDGEAGNDDAAEGDGSDVGWVVEVGIGWPTSCDATHPCAVDTECMYSTMTSCPTTGQCNPMRAIPYLTMTVCGCDGNTTTGRSVDGQSFTAPIAHIGPCYAPTTVCGELTTGVPDAGCPAGTMLALEVGGVAGGGPAWCAPIPPECTATPTCECLGACVCSSSSGRAERCSVMSNTIYCDNGLR
jgi:hypothetical protein